MGVKYQHLGTGTLGRAWQTKHQRFDSTWYRRAAGSFFFSASLLGSIVSGGGPRGGSRGEPARMLSDRQLEIFEMVGRGFDSHSIAEKLALSAKTVDAHKANIRQKLGLASARELFMEAVRWVEK